MATILITEDDMNIQLLMTERLTPFYTILCANNGEEALTIIETQPIDLLITDIMMPAMDGFELLKTLRQDNYRLPVLILTAKQSIEDKQTGFSFGTDDYLTKPVNYDELRWRIDALLRRANIANEKIIRIADIVIDQSGYTFFKGDRQIELNKKEFELLFKFLSYPGVIFTKNQLLDDIWGFDSESSEDTVKTHISRLRNQVTEFNEFQIITIKGLGYKGVIYE
ncbi:response regulator [Acetobacterium paludosum]|uniref:Heme response regulator HssR n=1 Tax=Acetobacterium paludosum TaxID=52693 RepID=A0A923HTL7_9FIRM|nr:response regulator transcription factor [Acetobacterium paludosum]MBC3887492.1 response regulator [Acetobacterium paludosum]